MTDNIAPNKFYYGNRENVIREFGGMAHIYRGKYLIQPDGNGSFDADGVDTKKDMNELVAEYRSIYPTAEFVNLG